MTHLNLRIDPDALALLIDDTIEAYACTLAEDSPYVFGGDADTPFETFFQDRCEELAPSWLHSDRHRPLVAMLAARLSNYFRTDAVAAAQSLRK